MAKPRVRVPKTAKAGQVVQIKTLISHKMDTGLRFQEIVDPPVFLGLQLLRVHPASIPRAVMKRTNPGCRIPRHAASGAPGQPSQGCRAPILAGSRIGKQRKN